MHSFFSIEINLKNVMMLRRSKKLSKKKKHLFKLFFRILEKDPYNRNPQTIALYLSSLVELKFKNELFLVAHKLVEESPNLPVSWYAVGCYYYLIQNFENARRYFT